MMVSEGGAVTQRIDNFEGGELEYAAYLLSLIYEGPLSESIHYLENNIKNRREPHAQSSTPPIAPVDKGPLDSTLTSITRPSASITSFTHNTRAPQTTIPLDTASVPSSGALDIKIWDPVTEYKSQPDPKASPKKTGTSAWVSRTSTFLQRIPESEEQWASTRVANCLSSAEDIIRAFDCITSSRLDRLGVKERFLPANTTHEAFQQSLCALGQRAGNIAAEGRFAHIISCYHSLIFVAICCVAEHYGHPHESVDTAQWEFYKYSGETSKDGERPARDRNSVRWVIQEMEYQYRRGLKHRAFEIFLLAGKELSFYKSCPKDKANILFSQRIPLCKAPAEIQASLPFWIPFLVKLCIGDIWSYTQVCEALDVTVLHEEGDFEHFQETYDSKKPFEYVLPDVEVSYQRGKHRISRRNAPVNESAKRRKTRHRIGNGEPSASRPWKELGSMSDDSRGYRPASQSASSDTTPSEDNEGLSPGTRMAQSGRSDPTHWISQVQASDVVGESINGSIHSDFSDVGRSDTPVTPHTVSSNSRHTTPEDGDTGYFPVPPGHASISRIPSAAPAALNASSLPSDGQMHSQKTQYVEFDREIAVSRIAALPTPSSTFHTVEGNNHQPEQVLDLCPTVQGGEPLQDDTGECAQALICLRDTSHESYALSASQPSIAGSSATLNLIALPIHHHEWPQEVQHTDTNMLDLPNASPITQSQWPEATGAEQANPGSTADESLSLIGADRTWKSSSVISRHMVPPRGDVYNLDSAEQPCVLKPLICRSSEQLFHRLPIVLPYDSPVFVSVQRGDLALTRALWRENTGLIDAVDPYGLGLLYYAAYYCWRSCGINKAIAMCEALIRANVRQDWLDEKASLPVWTIIDALVAECGSEESHFANFLSQVSGLFGQQIQDLLEKYHDARQFTEVHKKMLFGGQAALRDYLLRASGPDLPGLVDTPDITGRSALAWAVEYGLLRCVKMLLDAGADPNQTVGLHGFETTLLHSALAGPAAGKTETVYIDISATLIRAGAGVNALDAEGWTPLHVAASWGSHKGVESLANSFLLDGGAVTHNGETASQLAICTADDKLISLLQDLGGQRG